MSTRDPLGDRMKQYEAATRLVLQRARDKQFGTPA